MAESQILGISEMQANFAKLTSEMETRIGRRMVVAAGQILKREAKAIALSKGLRRTGVMINNIVIKREKTPAGLVQYNLGVRNNSSLTRKQKVAGKRLAVGKGGRIVVRYENNPYYWRFIEFGHRIVGRASGAQGYTTTTYTQRLSNGKTVTRTRKRSVDGLRGRRASSGGQVMAQPFLRPALENKVTEAIEAMNKALQAELAKVGNR